MTAGIALAEVAAARATARAVMTPAGTAGRLIGARGIGVFATVGQVSTLRVVAMARVPDGTTFFIVRPGQEPVIFGDLTFTNGRGTMYVDAPAIPPGGTLAACDENWDMVMQGPIL